MANEKNLLLKPNQLIGFEERNDISRMARHIWNFLLLYAQKDIKFNEHEGTMFEIKVSEVNDLADICEKDLQRLKKSIKCLMSPITIVDDPTHLAMISPVPFVDLDIERKVYVYKLEDSVIEMLKNTDYFTKLNLTDFNAFKSKYTYVIFEWLKRYETAHEIPKISVEDMRKITGTNAMKSYDNFANFNDKVLNVAISEINEKTKYLVSVDFITEVVKTRPKVTNLKFHFSKRNSEKDLIIVENEETENNSNPDVIQKMYHARYLPVCEKYLKNNFCSSTSEFFRATYLVDLSGLDHFLTSKDKYKNNKIKNKTNKPLKWLLDDIKKDINNGGKHGRWQNQIDYYRELLAELPPTESARYARLQDKEGFLEQVYKLEKRLGKKSKIKLPNWL